MQSAHEKAKRSGRTHSELLNLSVAEIADVRPLSFLSHLRLASTTRGGRAVQDPPRLRSPSSSAPLPSSPSFPPGVLDREQDGSLRIVFGNQAERKMLDARHDFDDVSKLTKAEMARFDKEKVDDFKKALEDFADSLAARQRIVRPLSLHRQVGILTSSSLTRPLPAPSSRLLARRSSRRGRSTTTCSPPPSRRTRLRQKLEPAQRPRRRCSTPRRRRRRRKPTCALTSSRRALARPTLASPVSPALARNATYDHLVARAVRPYGALASPCPRRQGERPCEGLLRIERERASPSWAPRYSRPLRSLSRLLCFESENEQVELLESERSRRESKLFRASESRAAGEPNAGPHVGSYLRL